MSTPPAARRIAIGLANLILATTATIAAASTPFTKPPARPAGPAKTDSLRTTPPITHPPLPVHPTQIIDAASGRPSWLVVLDRRPADAGMVGVDVDVSIDEVLVAAGLAPNRATNRYRHALAGFAADLTPIEAARLAADPRVATVDPDRRGRLLGEGEGGGDPSVESSWEHRRISDPDGEATSLDRCGATGAGVTVIVVDSGVNPDHTEMGDRVIASVNFVDDGEPDGRDLNGHGTGVASIAAGETIGVAPEAWIVSLRVADADGQISDASLVAALDWLALHTDELMPAVANLSLGNPQLGLVSSALETALATIEESGIPIFVAAGNESTPASWSAPACSVFATTVGATDSDDHPSPFSNFGRLVDLWAPGSAILNADWSDSDGGLGLENGTSEATPVVAGIAALHLERHPPTADELENGSFRIAQRTRLSLLASAAENRLSDRDDPIWSASGGNATLAGGPNLLVQSCDRAVGIDCDAPLQWQDGVASIRLGDGLTPIPEDFACTRFVSHPDGPVEISVGMLGIPWIDLPIDDDVTVRLAGASVRILDAADDRVLFDSDVWIASDPVARTRERVVRSSSVAGVRIDWTPGVESGPFGDMVDSVGYAMTAAVVDACPGDLDGDGLVNALDLQWLLVGWGICPESGPCVGDLDGDGVIGARDLGLLFVGWGECATVPPRGFILDCNGNPVLRSFLGDEFLDDGDRLRQVGLFGAIATDDGVVLDCEELAWDTDGSGFVLDPDDPREGACVGADGCTPNVWTACVDGFFFGPGVPCVPEPAVVDFLADFGDDSVTIGHPWLDDVQPGSNSRVRQVLPPGTTSISDAIFSIIPLATAGSGGLSFADDGLLLDENRGLRAPVTDFRVVIEFTDGGPPAIIDTTPATLGVIGIDSTGSIIAYRFGPLLESQSREIRSVEFSTAPTGIAPVSSVASLGVLYGTLMKDADDATPLMEISRDGGRTWELFIDDETGAPFQWGMSIRP